jgi:diaminopimelate decarboxylase
MYGSRYEVMLASRAPEGEPEVVTIAGKYCESGDILAKDVALPPLRPGDLLAMPAAGAYQIAMASNYNMALKPAIVLVRDGVARLVRRRETYRDLMNTDVRGE